MIEQIVQGTVKDEQGNSVFTYGQAVDLIRSELTPKVESGIATPDEIALLAAVTHEY